MFQAIRSRLLALYVLSFLVCMAGFAIAFRILFVHSLNQLVDLLRARDQEAFSKKLARSRVNCCRYL